jgi:hypothetical protein
MTRKPGDDYAVLAVSPTKLEERILAKYPSVRAFAGLVGHSSHTHIWRITKGQTRTTSSRTADVMEALLDAQGFLFARMSARSGDRAA